MAETLFDQIPNAHVLAQETGRARNAMNAPLITLETIAQSIVPKIAVRQAIAQPTALVLTMNATLIVKTVDLF